MESQSSFFEFESFSLGADAMVAADESQLALATPNGRVEICSIDGDSDTISIDESVEGLAIEQYVFAIADGQIIAYTTSGIELWSADVTDPREIVTLGQDGVLSCVTGEGRVVGIDTETGRELYATRWPHDDVAADSIVVGGHGRLIIASWSFLTAFDTRGEVVFDRNIEGAIEHVASLSDAVVVRLKNGQLISLDVREVTEQWSQSTDARSIATYGADGVLCVDDTGVSVVDEYGNVTPLDISAAESVLSTGDQRLVVTAAEQTQTVYRDMESTQPSLSATLLTETVRPGDDVRVTVTNGGTSSASESATLTIDPVDALRMRGTTATISLDGGETTELAFRVSDVVETGTVNAELTVGGTAIGGGQLSIQEQRDLSTAIDVAVDVVAFGGEYVDLAVTAENTRQAELGVGLPSSDVMRSLRPGKRESFETAVASDAIDQFGLEVSGDGETAVVPVDVSVPNEAPALSIEAAGPRSAPSIDAIVDNDTETTLTGTLSVRARSDALHCQRSITLDPGTKLLFAVTVSPEFVADGVSVTASIEEFGIEETADLTATDWDVCESDAAAGARVLSGETNERPPASLATDDDRPPATDLDVSRTVPDSVGRGERFTEQIEISNAGPATVTDIALDIGEANHTVERVEADQTVEISRSHAVFEQGPFTLPEGDVIAGGETFNIAERTIGVESTDIELDVTATNHGDDTKIEYVCWNTAESDCRIIALGVDGPAISPGAWTLDDSVCIEGGETVSFERTITDASKTSEPFRAGCQYQFAGNERTAYWTLTRSRDEGADGTDDTTGDENGVSVEIESASVPLTERNSTIDCTLRFSQAMRDVAVESTGSIISPLSAGTRTVGAVGAGETVTLGIDILPESTGTASFDLTVTGETTDSERSLHRRATGPVAATESEQVSDEWKVVPTEDRREPTAVHLVTTFRA